MRPGATPFVANKLQIKQANTKHNATAIYAHFDGAQRHAGADAGNITIFWFDQGWFWFIPLQNGITSIGIGDLGSPFLKTRGSRSLQQFLLDGVATCPALAQRLRQATLRTEVVATGNYSYTAGTHPTVATTYCSAMLTRSWTLCFHRASGWR